MSARGAGGYLISDLEPTQYTSSATMLLNDPSNSSVFSSDNRVVVDPSRHVRGQAAHAVFDPVMTPAPKLLHGRLSPAQLRVQVTANPSDTVDQLTITATDTTSQAAADVANDVAQAYRTIVRQSSEANARQTDDNLDQAVDNLRTQVNDLDQQIAKNGSNDPGLASAREVAAGPLLTVQSRANEIAVDTANVGDGAQLFESVDPPSSPSQPRPFNGALIGILLGLMAGCGISWWRGEYRRRVDEKQDAATVLGVPLLGDVPEFVASGGGCPLPVAFESYSRAAVTTLNLAIAMARDDRRVLAGLLGRGRPHVEPASRPRQRDRAQPAERPLPGPRTGDGGLSRDQRVGSSGTDRALPAPTALGLPHSPRSPTREPTWRRSPQIR
jgi:capsular polysaccharide biosynthesis protein